MILSSPVGFSRLSIRRLLHRVELQDDVAHGAKQHLALLGQNEAARVTMKERCAEVGFEGGDLTADR